MNRAGLAWLTALAFGVASPAGAQDYPEKPIRLIVPFPAGGPTDTAARIVAQGLSARIGQTVVVENQPGAGGTLGARQAATAAPDGHTLLMIAAANTFGTAPLLYKLDFDPLQAFAPVATVVVDKQIMVATMSLPVRTPQELVRYAKANPGHLNYGAAIGIGPHFLMELFKRKADVDIVHVPYRGSAPIIADLLGGQIQLTMSGKSVLLAQVQTGKLNATINDGLRSPEMRAGFARLGIEPKITTPAEFAALIAEEAPKWAEAVRITGIKAE